VHGGGAAERHLRWLQARSLRILMPAVGPQAGVPNCAARGCMGQGAASPRAGLGAAHESWMPWLPDGLR